MNQEKKIRVAMYCRVGSASQLEAKPLPQKEQLHQLLQRFLKEQEVQPCRKYRLLNQ